MNTLCHASFVVKQTNLNLPKRVFSWQKCLSSKINTSFRRNDANRAGPFMNTLAVHQSYHTLRNKHVGDDAGKSSLNEGGEGGNEQKILHSTPCRNFLLNSVKLRRSKFPNKPTKTVVFGNYNSYYEALHGIEYDRNYDNSNNNNNNNNNDDITNNVNNKALDNQVEEIVDKKDNEEELIDFKDMEDAFICRPYFKQTHFLYPTVRLAFVSNGVKRVTSDDLYNVYWGRHLPVSKLQKLNQFQKVNHFPGSHCLGRKDTLSTHLTQMKMIYGDEMYGFLPKTFILPFDNEAFSKEVSRNHSKLFTKKPPAGSCGRGITVDTAINYLQQYSEPSNQKYGTLLQEYIENPLLIDGLKFDMRLYVAVTSYSPLRIYLFHEGLVRFATSPYDKTDLTSKFSHLTNYSVNRRASNFVANENEENDGHGSKWSVRALKERLSKMGIDPSTIWKDIEDIIVKTLIAVQPSISSKVKGIGLSRDSCFELYGFDVMIDDNLKSHLLEVNILPCLSASSPLDKKIKIDALSQLFQLIGVVPYDRMNYDKEVKRLLNFLPEQIDSSHLSKTEKYIIFDTEDELSRSGYFKRLLPCSEDPLKYEQLMSHPKINYLDKLMSQYELSKLSNPPKISDLRINQ